MQLFKKSYVSHGRATRFLTDGAKYYIYFVDNSLLFPTTKECLKSVNCWCVPLDTFLGHFGDGGVAAASARIVATVRPLLNLCVVTV